MHHWIEGAPDLEAVYNNICEHLDSMSGYTPTRDRVFRVYEMLKPEDVKVIIVGQDPYKTYQGTHYADGIAFSLGLTSGHDDPDSGTFGIGGSQRTIEKALGKQLRSRDLEYLVRQGVLLINSYCTTTCVGKDRHTFWAPFTIGILRRAYNARHSLGLSLFSWGSVGRDLCIRSRIHNLSNVTYSHACHPSPHNESEYSSVPEDKRFAKCNHFQYMELLGIKFN